MRCNECGFDNPETHTYCGNCGQRLVAPAVSRSLSRAREEEYFDSGAPHASEPEPRRAPASLGGPSFLGLNGAENSGYEYLLEDEPPSYRGVWITLLLLAIIAIVAAAYWEPLRTIVISTANRYSRTPAPPPAQTAPAPPAAENPPASQPALAADAAKQSGDTSQSQPGQQAASSQNDHNETQPKTESKTQNPSVQESKAGSADKSTDEEDTAAEETASAEPRSRGRAATSRETDQLVASGEKYLYGRGVPRNCNQALGFLRAAAEQEDPRALSRLGALYSVGECVPQDRVMAYAWFSRAREADPRNPLLERNLNILWRDMTSDERRRVLGTNR